MTMLSSLDRRKQGSGVVLRSSTVFKFRVVVGCFLTLISTCCVSVLTIISRQQQQHDRHQQQQQQSSSSNRMQLLLPPTIIDILSIGSVSRRELQQAQRETMASHESIRHFFAISEHNDTSEPNCHMSLTMSHVRRVVNFCRRPGKNSNNNHSNQQQPHYHLEKMRQHYATLKWLTKKSNPPGWLCAQKRPIDGFRQIMSFYQQQQQEQEHSLPDYLIIMDDDTYMNINSIVDFLPRHYHHHSQNGDSSSSSSSSSYTATTTKIPALAIAGCRIRSRIYEHNMTIPFGGMGVILSRQTLENFVTPIFCPYTNNNINNTSSSTTTAEISDFERLACWRLAQNGAGERKLFQQGMTLIELMHAYTTAYPYMHADRWKQGVGAILDNNGKNKEYYEEEEDGVGFCMHSDWMWGYFINVYPVSVHTNDEPFFQNVFEDRLQGYNGSTIYAGRKSHESNAQLKQCRHKNAIDDGDGDDSSKKSCPPESHICHRLSERRMRELYQQQQQQLLRQQQRE